MLLAIVMFIFGVTLMQLAYAHLQTNEADTAEVTKYYGTLGRSMLTLFMAISGGIDWKDSVAPLGPMSWILDYFMGVYVFFTLFCFINVITGIFVDNAKALGETEAMHQRSALALKRKMWVKKVLALFAQLDSGQEGDLSYEEFAAEIQDERVQDCFRHLGINVENHSVDELFDLFDVDAEGKIDQSSFEQAIRQFHGHARSIDVYKLRRETQKIAKQVRSLLQ
ncbi:CACNA1H, partial [Symbiodinium necroappetens]